MKKFLATLVLSLLFFSAPSQADDIRDIEIAGMSIGDSLLDYMTEDEIFEEIELNKYDYPYLNEPNKYAEVYIRKEFKIYEYISVFINNKSSSKYLNNKNEKYIILGIRGMIVYNEDFDNCIQKRDEIAEELSMMLPNSYKSEYHLVHPFDPSGNSFQEHVSFDFDSGEIVDINCNNFDETFRIKHDRYEGLNIQLYNKEITSWMRNRP